MGNKNSGPRPRPTALKVLQGNPGHRALNLHEPTATGPVVKPADVSPGASAAWDRLAPVVLQMGTLTAGDVAAFAELCELQATAALATAEKSRPDFSPFLVTTMVDSAGNEHQNVKIHPAIKLEGETAVKLRAYYDYFGMTPSSRARLFAPKREAAPVSKWAGSLA